MSAFDEDYPATMAPWEDVASEMSQKYPEADPGQLRSLYEQARSRSRFTQLESQPFATHALRAIPIFNQAPGMLEAEARDRVARGHAEQSDYDVIAYRDRMNEIAARRSSLESVGTALESIPAMLGEAIGAGKVVGGLGGGAASPYGGLASVGRAVGGFAGRTAAMTALMPSMWGDEWRQGNIREGRSPNDWRGLPTAFTMGALNTAVLGSLGGFAQGLGGAGIKGIASRILARTGIGMLEQQGIDAFASAVSEVLPKVWKLKTDYGLVGNLWRGTTARMRGDSEASSREYGELWKHALTQAVTFAAFSALHEYQDPYRAVQDIREAINSGETRQEALQNLQEHNQEQVTSLQQREQATQGENAPESPVSRPAGQEAQVPAEPPQSAGTVANQPVPDRSNTLIDRIRARMAEGDPINDAILLEGINERGHYARTLKIEIRKREAQERHDERIAKEQAQAAEAKPGEQVPAARGPEYDIPLQGLRDIIDMSGFKPEEAARLRKIKDPAELIGELRKNATASAMLEAIKPQDRVADPFPNASAELSSTRSEGNAEAPLADRPVDIRARDFAKQHPTVAARWSQADIAQFMFSVQQIAKAGRGAFAKKAVAEHAALWEKMSARYGPLALRDFAEQLTGYMNAGRLPPGAPKDVQVPTFKADAGNPDITSGGKRGYAAQDEVSRLRYYEKELQREIDRGWAEGPEAQREVEASILAANEASRRARRGEAEPGEQALEHGATEIGDFNPHEFERLADVTPQDIAAHPEAEAVTKAAQEYHDAVRTDAERAGVKPKSILRQDIAALSKSPEIHEALNQSQANVRSAEGNAEVRPSGPERGPAGENVTPIVKGLTNESSRQLRHQENLHKELVRETTGKNDKETAEIIEESVRDGEAAGNPEGKGNTSPAAPSVPDAIPAGAAGPAGSAAGGAATGGEQRGQRRVALPLAEGQTSIANEAMQHVRKGAGLAELVKADEIANKPIMERAKKTMAENPNAGEEIIQRLMNERRPPNDYETGVMMLHAGKVVQAHDKAQVELNTARREGKAPEVIADAEHRAALSREALDRITEATRFAGELTGRALKLRQAVLNEQFTPTALIRRAEAAKGSKLSEQEHSLFVEAAEKESALRKEQNELGC